MLVSIIWVLLLFNLGVVCCVVALISKFVFTLDWCFVLFVGVGGFLGDFTCGFAVEFVL